MAVISVIFTGWTSGVLAPKAPLRRSGLWEETLGLRGRPAKGGGAPGAGRGGLGLPAAAPPRPRAPPPRAARGGSCAASRRQRLWSAAGRRLRPGQPRAAPAVSVRGRRGAWAQGRGSGGAWSADSRSPGDARRCLSPRFKTLLPPTTLPWWARYRDSGSDLLRSGSFWLL